MVNVYIIYTSDAARRFYQSILETAALKEKGKYQIKVAQQRRKNRITRVCLALSLFFTLLSLFKFFLYKLESRKSALITSTATTAEMKESLKKVMLTSFMSSEESGEESVDGQSEKRAIILVKPLPWRSPRLSCILKQLDWKASRKKSKQSRQQTRTTRQKPAGFPENFLGFADN